MTTAAEQQALADIAAAEARGEDAFGDDEELVRDDGAKADADTIQDSDGAPKADQDPAAEGAQAEPAAEPAQLPTYKVDLPADHKTQRAELLKAKAEAMKQLMDGEIDAEEFATIESELADKLEDLTAQRIRAETLQEANAQSQQAYQQREIHKLIRRAQGEVDYTKDASAAKKFDQALAIISADPDNQGADYAELIDSAHRMVLAMLGLKAAPATREPRKPDADAPVTLRNLPAAATPNSNGGVIEQLSRLKGAAYEAAFQKLSPAQRASLLDEATED